MGVKFPFDIRLFSSSSLLSPWTSLPPPPSSSLQFLHFFQSHRRYTCLLFLLISLVLLSLYSLEHILLTLLILLISSFSSSTILPSRFTFPSFFVSLFILYHFIIVVIAA